jgi:DNA-binding response OmpR family regulator
MLVGFRFGHAPSIVASILSVLLFDVLFTEPYFTVVVHDTQYIITFAVMLVVGLIIATLTARVRRQAELSRANERRIEALYRLGRKLTGINGQDFIAAETERAVAEVLGGETAVFLPHDGSLRPILDHRARFAADPSEIAVAQWTYDHGQIAGRGTDTLPSAQALYLPLQSPNGTVGVLAVRHGDVEQLLLPEYRQILENYSTQVAMAIDRDRLTLESDQARIDAETERLRSTLTKPFGVGELLARIRVALRHVGEEGDAESAPLTVGDLCIDFRQRRVSLRGKEVRLTPIEYRILTTLARNAGKLVTHRQLLKEVWGPDRVLDKHYLRVYITYLRRKIEPHPARPQYVLTEQGIGYRLGS